MSKWQESRETACTKLQSPIPGVLMLRVLVRDPHRESENLSLSVFLLQKEPSQNTTCAGNQWECPAFWPMAMFVFAPFSGHRQKSLVTLVRVSSPHSSQALYELPPHPTSYFKSSLTVSVPSHSHIAFFYSLSLTAASYHSPSPWEGKGCFL